MGGRKGTMTFQPILNADGVHCGCSIFALSMIPEKTRIMKNARCISQLWLCSFWWVRLGLSQPETSRLVRILSFRWVTMPEGKPALDGEYSPDGKAVFYRSKLNGTWTLMSVETKRSTQKRIWSDSGKFLGFSVWGKGNPSVPYSIDGFSSSCIGCLPKRP